MKLNFGDPLRDHFNITSTHPWSKLTPSEGQLLSISHELFPQVNVIFVETIEHYQYGIIVCN